MYIAVYGTLKKGFRNHKLMDPQAFRFVGSFFTADQFHMVSAGGFPIVYKSPQTHNIQVEVYRVVDEAHLSHLDRLEGHPDWYKREPVEIQGFENAWMYLQDKPPERELRYQNVRYTEGKASWVKSHD